MIRDKVQLLKELKAIQLWDTEYFRESPLDERAAVAFQSRQMRRREILQELNQEKTNHMIRHIVPVSAREGSMHHKSQGHLLRRLVWIEKLNCGGWACSDCGWIFRPSGPFKGESLQEVTEAFQAKLYEEFESHDCSRISPHQSSIMDRSPPLR